MTLLSEVKERVSKASPGPWKGDRYDGSVKYELIGQGGRKVLSLDAESPGFFSFYDEEFIKHSREDIEYLLKLIEAKDEALRKIGNRIGAPTMSYAPEIERKEMAQRVLDVSRIVQGALTLGHAVTGGEDAKG